MPDAGTIELSDQQQHSSPLIQNNNGNDRSPTSTSAGAQETSTPIIDLLENMAKMLGGGVCGWVLVVLVGGGMVGSLETKDCWFITLLFLLVLFRCWRHFFPQVYWSFTDVLQSALPSCCNRELFYCFRLVFAMTSVVLSGKRLASQDFGKQVADKGSRDFALKVFYGLTLAEALVLLLWLANGPGDDLEVELRTRGNSVGLVNGPGDDLEVELRTRGNSVGLVNGPGDDLEVGLRTRGNSVGLANGPGDGLEVGLITRGNSVGLADGPGDDLEVGLRTRGNSVGLADGPGDGLEVGLIRRGNSVGLADGPGDGLDDGPGDRPEDSPGDGPEDRPADSPENGPRGEPEDGFENGPGGEPGDGSGDVPVNQSNECNAMAQMDRPANQSNNFNSEGPADSLPNLRQRRRKIPFRVLDNRSEVQSMKSIGRYRASLLRKNNINTVEDFLKVYYNDEAALRKILGIKSKFDKGWTSMVKHAMQCADEFHAKYNSSNNSSHP